MSSKWSQDQYTRCNVSEIEKKRKMIHQILTTSLNINIAPNPPPMYDYSYNQIYSPFLSRVTKGKSVK